MSASKTVAKQPNQQSNATNANQPKGPAANNKQKVELPAKAKPSPATSVPAPSPSPSPLPPAKPKRKKKIPMPPYIIKKTDMRERMRIDAVKLSAEAIHIFPVESEIAAFIARNFDEIYGPHWQCLVGRNFGVCIEYESENYINIFMDKYSIMLFKTKRGFVKRKQKTREQLTQSPCAQKKSIAKDKTTSAKCHEM